MEAALHDSSQPNDAVGLFPHRLADAGICLGVAIAYFIAAKLGLKFAIIHASASAIWPPTGLSLAAFLLLGSRVWPGIFVGAFAANITTAGSIPVCIAIAGGNTLEGLAAAWLMERFANGTRAFFRTQDVLAFLGLSALLSPLISATIGTFSLSMGGFAPWPDFGSIWITWWLGDAAGAMIVAPVLILWATDWKIRWKRLQWVEALLLLATILVTTRVVWGGWQPGGKNHPSSYFLWPVLTWAALRFSPRETATSLVLISGFGLFGTLNGLGPFSRESTNENLMVLQAFLGICNAMALVLAADVAEREQAQGSLLKAREELEARVVDRTANLLRVNSDLLTEVREREKAEKEVRRLAAIVSHSDAAIMSADLDGIIRTWNPGAEKLFGYPAAEIIGKNATTLVPPELQGQVDQLFERMRKGEHDQLESRRRRKDGSLIDVLVTSSPIKDLDGHTIGFSAVMRDISTRKRMEEDLRKTTEQLMHSNAELNLFASAVSHELQEPVRKIVAFGDLVNPKVKDPSLDDYVTRMKSAAKRMQRLIDGLLSLSRVTTQAHPVEPIDLDPVVHEAVADLRESITAEGGSLKIGKLPTVQGDSLQLRQLFQNLAGNAFKFRKKDEPLKLAISAGKPHNGFVDITVSDNGIGFEQQDARRIFEPFQRLHRRGEYEGSGLGLAICERIALRHGGEIRAESEPGKGSKFTVTLPA